MPQHRLSAGCVFTLGLVNPKSVTSWYDTRNTKEVLSPLPVAEHNHVGADPHYCTLTSNLQVTPMSHKEHLAPATCCTSLLHIAFSVTVMPMGHLYIQGLRAVEG